MDVGLVASRKRALPTKPTVCLQLTCAASAVTAMPMALQCASHRPLNGAHSAAVEEIAITTYALALAVISVNPRRSAVAAKLLTPTGCINAVGFWAETVRTMSSIVIRTTMGATQRAAIEGAQIF